jgi:hypothetical protein
LTGVTVGVIRGETGVDVELGVENGAEGAPVLRDGVLLDVLTGFVVGVFNGVKLGVVGVLRGVVGVFEGVISGPVAQTIFFMAALSRFR